MEPTASSRKIHGTYLKAQRIYRLYIRPPLGKPWSTQLPKSSEHIALVHEDDVEKFVNEFPVCIMAPLSTVNQEVIGKMQGYWFGALGGSFGISDSVLENTDKWWVIIPSALVVVAEKEMGKKGYYTATALRGLRGNACPTLDEEDRPLSQEMFDSLEAKVAIRENKGVVLKDSPCSYCPNLAQKYAGAGSVTRCSLFGPWCGASRLQERDAPNHTWKSIKETPDHTVIDEETGEEPNIKFSFARADFE